MEQIEKCVVCSVEDYNNLWERILELSQQNIELKGQLEKAESENTNLLCRLHELRERAARLGLEVN